jgi:hypothetical protein
MKKQLTGYGVLNWLFHGDVLADKYHASKKQSLKSFDELARNNKPNGKR